MQAGYAFMMYLYSQPISHVNNPGNGASRPDKHILIMVSMPLLEVSGNSAVQSFPSSHTFR
jgi:hypothetical protein